MKCESCVHSARVYPASSGKYACWLAGGEVAGVEECDFYEERVSCKTCRFRCERGVSFCALKGCMADNNPCDRHEKKRNGLFRIIQTNRYLILVDNRTNEAILFMEAIFRTGGKGIYHAGDRLIRRDGTVVEW